MSDAKWTITSSKRRPTGNSSSSRKRVRISDDMSNRRASRPSNEQQTLTQISFVNSPSIENDEAPSDFEPLSTVSPQHPVPKPPPTLKSDSTPTQMDFVGRVDGYKGRKSTDRGISMPPPVRKQRKQRNRTKKRDSTLTQMDFFNAGMDGTAELDETMLPDPGDVITTPQKNVPGPEDPLSSMLTSDEKEQYITPREHQARSTGKRKRDQNDERLQTEKRRRSGRIAATLSPKVDMAAIRAGSRNARRTPASVPPRPLLEIQDSTDFIEAPFEEAAELSNNRLAVAMPSTPSRTSARIPSSQTPESIQLKTSPSVATPTSRRLERQPLAEISNNVRRSGRKKADTKMQTAASPKGSLPRKRTPRKICTLKISRDALASLARGHRADDSEHDVYSLQPTSSPTRAGLSSEEDPKDGRASASSGKIERKISSLRTSSPNYGPTIKETASSQRRVDSQYSLPDISDVLGIELIGPSDDQNEELPTEGPTAASSSRQPLPSEHAKAGVQVEDEMLLDNEPLNMIPELEQISTDGLSDFGSPVRNDTQFVKSLYERLSSPGPAPHGPKRETRGATVPYETKATPPTARRLSQSIHRPFQRSSPLPAPELVFKSPPSRGRRQKSGNSKRKELHSSSTRRNPLENVTVSFLPLNDTIEHRQSSSSPSLPPVPSSSTQKSVNLASIPHPSQVSTQVPSQGYIPSSSAPQTFPAPHDSEAERIIIKDSSSVPAYLSQIATHIDGLESLGEALHDEDDLDLNVSTYKMHSSSKRRRALQASTTDEEEADITQTPTERSRKRGIRERVHPSTQSSPIIIGATTRSQRDAKLEVVALTSSSSPSRSQHHEDKNITPRPRNIETVDHEPSTRKGKDTAIHKPALNPQESSPSSSLSSSLYSPSPPRDLRRKYTPIPGFDNDTQSDYTQGGHVTAAYVHRMWDRGDLPRSFVPKPYKVKNFRPSMRNSSGSGKKGKQSSDKSRA